MPVLHLGVIELNYIQPPTPGKKAPKNPGKKGKFGPHRTHAKKYENVTTGDVAEILEARYHIFEHFWENHQGEIIADLEKSLEGTIESLLMGAPTTIDPYGEATSKIEDLFKQMLATKELETLGYPGIPTAAALRGVSHRFARAYLRRPPRPSFIDTGMFQASMKAWLD